ncbi:MAG: TPM domain-containing protein, partial [Deferribacteres bacterium]|nr:TPM domain-containing protein [Deferribacteres bacterium]
LEGIIPDSLAGSIGRQYLVPYFRKKDYSTGIAKATLALINIIASDAGVEITGMPKLRTRSAYRGKPTIAGTIFGILFVIGLVYLFIRHPRLLIFLFMMNMLGGGRGGGWGGGGGFGGGFGGGGGGGFGGGGASGGW